MATEDQRTGVTVHYGGVQNISVVFENVSLRGVEALQAHQTAFSKEAKPEKQPEILLQEQCDKEKEE